MPAPVAPFSWVTVREVKAKPPNVCERNLRARLQDVLELLREDDGDMLDDEEDEGEELNLMVGIDDVSDLEDDDEEEEDSAGTLRGVIGVEV